MNSNARGINSSPGIYTREIDLSQVSTKSLGVTTLGLAGETLIGPAFQPIPISTYSEFQTYFGGTNPEKYANGYPKYELGYIAKDYLQQSQQLYVTRVLGLSGYKYNKLWALNLTNASGNTTTNNITNFAAIRSKAYYAGETLTPYVTGVTISLTGDTLTSIGVSSIDTSFNIVAALASGTSEIYNVSLNPAYKNYILKVLGSSPKNPSHSKLFVEEMYQDVIINAQTGTAGTLSDNFKSGSIVTISGDTNHDDYSTHFSYAKTPWFVSEMKGYNKVIPLFRFLTLSDGENANNLFKVSIRNIRPLELKFDIIVRAIYDTDSKPIILEQYTNCTLDPSDGNYYLGAQVGTIDEIYILKSKYIIVEIIDDEKVIESIPMGFEGYEIKQITGVDSPIISYNNKYTDTGSSSAKNPFFGVTNTVDSDLFNYKGLSGITLTNGFHLEPGSTGVSGFTDPVNSGLACTFTALNSPTYAIVSGDTKLMKFTAYFSGGFDGWDIFRANRTNTDDYQYNNYVKKSNTEGFTITDNFKPFGALELGTTYGIPDVPVSTGLTSDFYAFWSAARSFSDPEAVDINVFATPGIDWRNNSILVTEIIDMVENERKDSIYILTTPDKEAIITSNEIGRAHV